jgi:creatinine amidohydrolase
VLARVRARDFALLYLDGDHVRKDRIKSGVISFNEEGSPFNWVDLFRRRPATLVSWTSSYSDTASSAMPELATPEKGARRTRKP